VKAVERNGWRRKPLGSVGTLPVKLKVYLYLPGAEPGEIVQSQLFR